MSRERVLVVDDDPQIMGLLKRVLEQSDFAVLTASDGECGWTTVCEEHPSVIVTDVMMPKLDGFELVRRVRADPLVGATPLMILSAKAEEEDQIKGLELGADDYLVKPFSLDVFLARIHALLRRRSQLLEGVQAPVGGPFAQPSLSLLADCTFETLVVGKGNRRAVEAAKAVVADPGRVYNPFFVFGEPGRGKTHLIAAMANAMYQRNPGARIFYLTSEIFSQQILEAYEKRTVDLLRASYLSSDALFIDDIQFLAVSPSLQTVASGIFSEMYRLHRQVVISGDRRPEELPALTEEISAGFAAGLVQGIEAPDAELRASILRRKAIQKGWPVPLALLDELAARLDSDVRTLEGAAKRLVAMKVIDGLQLDSMAIERAIASVCPDVRPSAVPVSSHDASRTSLPIEPAPGCGVAIAWGTPEEMAAIVPQARATTIVVLGVSAGLVTDAAWCLAGLRHDQSGVPEGKRWALVAHPDVPQPDWVILGTNCWSAGDDLSWAIEASPAPIYLAVLDSAGGRIMEARQVVASIPRGASSAVAVLFGGMGVGTQSEVRQRLSASMRRLFRVPPEVPVIVSVAVTRPEARRWLEVALHGEDASSAR